MSILRRKSVRVMGIILGVLVIVALGVKIFLPAEKIRDLALEQARAKLGREVTVGEVAVSLRGGIGVKLGELAIHNPDGFPGEPFLATQAVDLKLAIGPLFKGEFRVHRLEIEAPVLNLTVLADSTNNFTFEPVASDTGPGSAVSVESPAAQPPLSVANFAIRNGQIVYADATNPQAGVRVTDVALNLALDDPAPGRYQATGHLATGPIIMTGTEGVPELEADLDFDLIWDGSSSALEIVRADGLILDLPLTCTGQLAFGATSPTGRVQVQTKDQALVDLAAFAPPELAEKIKGDRNSGTVGAKIDMELVADDVAPVRIKGKAEVRNADLALAQPFLPPEQPGTVAGRGDLDVEFATDPKDRKALTYWGILKLQGVSFTNSGLVDELQDLDAVVRFTPTKFAAESCQAQFASGKFDLKGSLEDPFPYFLPPELQGDTPMKKPHLQFTLRSPRLDVDRLIPAASPTGSGSSDGGGKSPAGKTTAGMEFPDLTSDGTFQADTLIYMQVPFTGVTGNVKIRDRVLECTDVKGGVYNGTVDGKVAIELQDLQNPSYSGEYQARNIEVNKFMERFSPLSGVVFGGCNMSGGFKAQGRDPEAIRSSLTLSSDAGVQNGRVLTTGPVYSALNTLAAQAGQTLDKEQSLKDLATHIKVENGRVGLNDLTTKLGQWGDLTFSGSYGFAGDLSYDGQILMTKAQTDRLFSSGAMAELGKLLGSQKPERLLLPLSVGGTRVDPKVKLDMSSVVKDLQARAAKEQGQKLEDEAKNKLNDLLNKWK